MFVNWDRLSHFIAHQRICLRPMTTGNMKDTKEATGAYRYATALTIAGSDSCGGAGIQADLKTFSALGVYGMSAITAITAQNTWGVRSIQAVDAKVLRDQIEAVFDDFTIDAVKIGMLYEAETVRIVAELLERYRPNWVIVDPVMISTSGTLRMKKNDVVQISLVDPIIGIAEVGRMEFTKDKMLVIDRVNRRYVSVAYNNIGFLKNAKVDFYALQALFWNEIFEPGKKEPEEKAFSLKKNRNTVNLNYSDSMLAYDFETSLDDARLHKTSVDDNGVKKYSLSCSYSDFTDFEGGMFPKNIKLTFNGGKETMSLSMQLSSLRNESGWLARTTVPSKYSSVKPEDILKMLVK